MAITFKMQQDKDMCITTVYCKTIFAVVKMLQKIGEKLNETWCWPVQESYETWDSILHNIVDQINYVVFNRMKHFLVLVGIGLQTPREIIWFFFTVHIRHAWSQCLTRPSFFWSWLKFKNICLMTGLYFQAW